jgi:hypothetical protein
MAIKMYNVLCVLQNTYGLITGRPGFAFPKVDVDTPSPCP